MSEKWSLCKQKWKELWSIFFFQCYVPSLVCYAFIEGCSRKSVIEPILFFLREPLVFLYNAFLIATTVSVCLLFRRRTFVRLVVLVLWAAVGVVDFVLLMFRTTPFTAVDLALVKDALAIANRYLSPGGTVLVILGVLVVSAGCVWMFCKAKKEEKSREYLFRVPFCGLLILCCIAMTNIGMATGLLERNFGNLAQAFHDNGLPYCFLNSVLNTGIERPEEYSEELMEDFLEKYEEEEGQEPEGKGPNLIFLQLESFFDVNYVEDFSCTENPVSFFSYLRENYPSGFLEVPSIGAGTANTEFECITGMNLDLFGPGEYPYKTVLKERTCESLAYILKESGYTATAMHNNDGTFYDRHLVFSNLGFNRYISLEYMRKAEENELSWAKDKVLTGEIMRVLAHTKERDFIYAISVQGHGAYPEEPVLAENSLDIQLPEELSEYYYQYLYYVHQLKEMDDFIKELVLNLSSCQEEVVLVLYGDHLPSLELSDDLLKNKNAFQTEYVIWSNFALQAEDADLQSYQLTARVLEVLDMVDGIMPQYHQHHWDDEDYLDKMQLLMYDMLYGEMEVYDGVNPYEPTALQMGLKPIRIREVYLREALPEKEEPMLYVSGQNFTEYSKVSVNEEEVETIFLTDRLLAVRKLPKTEEDVYYIKVQQKGSDDIVLSETEVTEYRPEE